MLAKDTERQGQREQKGRQEGTNRKTGRGRGGRGGTSGKSKKNLSHLTSDAAVRFGPVQRILCLNLGPDFWFGSSRLLNLGLDLEGPVWQVRFG